MDTSQLTNWLPVDLDGESAELLISTPYEGPGLAYDATDEWVSRPGAIKVRKRVGIAPNRRKYGRIYEVPADVFDTAYSASIYAVECVRDFLSDWESYPVDGTYSEPVRVQR